MSFDRMWQALAPIGRDRRTGGYRRYVWTDAERTCREWFADEAARRGMDVETDRNGNLWAWLGDPDSDGPGIVTGSHLDSVPDGGAYDGALGVISAFAAVDRITTTSGSSRHRSRPIGIVAFADEEGARFGVACAGSRLSTGGLDPDHARGLTDDDGVSYARAMRRAGLDPERIGADPATLARIGAFVELHIEQGRGLVETEHAVGLASEIWPHGRWRFEFTGRADHAGTTRMEDRADPMLTYAMTVLAANKRARLSGIRATFGRVGVEPNGTNAIPSRVLAWLDARAPTEAELTAETGDIERQGRKRAGRDGTALAVHRESVTPAIGFDTDLRARLRHVLDNPPELSTAAGHDAGILAAAGVPAAMLYVRNPTGISHAPQEHAERADCLAGIDALATVLTALADSSPEQAVRTEQTESSGPDGPDGPTPAPGGPAS